jgi:hypothetical protein
LRTLKNISVPSVKKENVASSDISLPEC